MALSSLSSARVATSTLALFLIMTAALTRSQLTSAPPSSEPTTVLDGLPLNTLNPSLSESISTEQPLPTFNPPLSESISTEQPLPTSTPSAAEPSSDAVFTTLTETATLTKISTSTITAKPTSSSDVTSGPDQPTPAPKGDQKSSSLKLGVGIGLGTGIPLVLALIVVFWFWRRRPRQGRVPLNSSADVYQEGFEKQLQDLRLQIEELQMGRRRPTELQAESRTELSVIND